MTRQTYLVIGALLGSLVVGLYAWHVQARSYVAKSEDMMISSNLTATQDMDADGIPDEEDNCPAVPNPTQSDIDLDDRGDACDNCVRTFNPEQVNSDPDSFGNACDNCVAVPNEDQADDEGDDIGNACDACPTIPSPQCSSSQFAAINAAFRSPTATTSESAAAGQPNTSGLLIADFATSQVFVLGSNGDGTFRNISQVTVGQGPVALAVSDFNRDGKTDIVTANSVSDSVTVGLGDGQGAFTNTSTYFLLGPCRPSSLAVADFKRDGHSDVAVTCSATTTIYLLFGNGDGTLSQAVLSPFFAFGPGAIVAADFNSDGNSDVAVTNVRSHDLIIFLGDGEGRFSQATRFFVGSGPVSVSTGDFNQDGRVDLIVANFISNDIVVLLGRGGGDFDSATAPRFQLGFGPTSLTLGEFVKGRQGVAVTDFLSNDVGVALGNQAGAFTRSATLASFQPLASAVGDFNNDGHLDIVAISPPSTSLSVFLGKGDGTFTRK